MIPIGLVLRIGAHDGIDDRIDGSKTKEQMFHKMQKSSAIHNDKVFD